MTDIARRSALITLVALLFCACSTTSASYTDLNPPPHELYVKRPKDVEIFTSAPELPHTDVGLITVEEGDVGASNPEQLIRMMRETAARAGCDALVVAPPGSKTQAALGGFVDHPQSYRVYSGTCVVYGRK